MKGKAISAEGLVQIFVARNPHVIGWLFRVYPKALGPS